MARPIRETPILYGDAARRFEERMKVKRHDDPEKRKRRLENYQTVLAMLERGEREHKLKQQIQHGKTEMLEGEKTKKGRCLFVISKIVSIFAL